MPTFAGKIKLPVDTVLPVLALVGLLGAAIVTEPWLTYLIVAAIYVTGLPISAFGLPTKNQHRFRPTLARHGRF